MKTDKKSLRQQTDYYWKKYWEHHPYYPHQVTWFKVYSFKGNYGKLDSPKLKKKRFYPKEYNYYKGCPKYWNKLHHIRPIRKENKYWAKMSCTLDEDLIYLAEERFYPQYKMHIYYY